MGQHSGSKAFYLVGAISKKINGALTPVSDISCYAIRVPISKTFLLSSLMPLIETAPSAQYKEPFSRYRGRFMPLASSANHFLAQEEEYAQRERPMEPSQANGSLGVIGGASKRHNNVKKAFTI